MTDRSLQAFWIRCFCVWIGIIVFWAAGNGLASEYLSVTGPCDFSFPQDHGSHADYQTEWWYYTGHLMTESGRPFGFQLTFFRRQIVPLGEQKAWPSHPSSWRTENIFMAHAAISDIADERFYWDEDIARGAAGLAGVQKGDVIKVFLGQWAAAIAPSAHHLTAKADTFSLDIKTTPLKAPTAHGDRGYSRKGVRPESASCYYSITRLDATGALSVKGRRYKVQGTAWMDHEYSTAPLEPSLVGWDWFSLQFADDTELMLYILRGKEGSGSPASSGTFIPSMGPPQHLDREDIQVEVMKRWRSPHSGADYPCRWRIRVPLLQLDVAVESQLGDQELRLTRSMRVSYWEGCVKVKGRKASRVIEGMGYVELTGYAAPFDLLGQDRKKAEAIP